MEDLEIPLPSLLTQFQRTTEAIERTVEFEVKMLSFVYVETDVVSQQIHHKSAKTHTQLHPFHRKAFLNMVAEPRQCCEIVVVAELLEKQLDSSSSVTPSSVQELVIQWLEGT